MDLQFELFNNGPQLDLEQIQQKVAETNVNLSSDYRDFLLRNNGGHPDPNLIVKFSLPEEREDAIGSFYDLETVMEPDDDLPTGWLEFAYTEEQERLCFSDTGAVFYNPDGGEPFLLTESFTAFLELLKVEQEKLEPQGVIHDEESLHRALHFYAELLHETQASPTSALSGDSAIMVEVVEGDAVPVNTSEIEGQAFRLLRPDEDDDHEARPIPILQCYLVDLAGGMVSSAGPLPFELEVESVTWSGSCFQFETSAGLFRVHERRLGAVTPLAGCFTEQQLSERLQQVLNGEFQQPPEWEN